MTDAEGGAPEEADPEDPATADGSPSTLPSAVEPVRRSGARAVPDVGRWVGPEDEPARYRVLEHVAGGAEGAIHRARFVGRHPDPQDPPGRVLALKEYRPPRGASPDWPHEGTWLQIRDQALLLNGLPRSPHLVTVREVFLGAMSTGAAQPRTDFTTPFVVMGWVDGTAPDVLLHRGGISLATRLGWIADLAAAVDLLHSVSHRDDTPLVHGDIKPGNCLVTDDHGLVLVDTGALQRADGVGDHRGLRTPRFAAPEVLAHPGRRRGEATDLYSLGAVAFFLLTGRLPPSAARPAYLAEAEETLQACVELPPAGAADVTAHVLTMLSPDPADRGREGARAWAARLTTLAALPTPAVPSVPLLRRRGALVAAGLGAVVVVTAALTVPTLLDDPAAGFDPARVPADAPSFVPSEAGAPPPSTASWPERAFTGLAPFTAGGGALLYDQPFTGPVPDWPAAATDAYTTRYATGGYALHILGRGVFVPVPAPPAGSVTDEVVSATAMATAGQGAWGVWCRGRDERGSQRYTFLISHAGAVQIVEPGDVGSGWVYVTGLDLSVPVTLSARCADVVGAPVELTLAVNGRIALTYRPRSVLGPGYAGIEGMTFSDVTGPTVSATYRHFDIRRAGS